MLVFFVIVDIYTLILLAIGYDLWSKSLCCFSLDSINRYITILDVIFEALPVEIYVLKGKMKSSAPAIVHLFGGQCRYVYDFAS